MKKLLFIVALFWASLLPASAQTALSSVTAATTTTSINNGNNPITWNWDLTGSGTAYAFCFCENTASTITGNPVGVLWVDTLAGSTLVPATIQNSITGSQTLGTLYIQPTWNTSANVVGGIFENVTDTSSGSNSLMMSLLHNSAIAFNVDKNGNTTAGGTASANSFATSGTLTTVNCSTSGTVKFAEPAVGTTDKRVIALATSCVGTASYTFPTAFSGTPQIVTTDGPAASVVTSKSTTAMTVTGATTTGFIVLVGF